VTNGTADLRALLAPDVVDALEELIDRRARALLGEMSEPEWLTLDEAAGRYRSTVAALRKRAERDKLPGAVKDEGRWLLHRPTHDAALRDKLNGTGSKRGERRVNGPAPGRGGINSHAR
jgi:hypothetical protein